MNEYKTELWLDQQDVSPKRQLFRWTIWFFSIHLVICWALAGLYYDLMPSFTAQVGAQEIAAIWGWGFYSIAFLVQCCFALFLCGLLMTLLLRIYPRRWFVFTAGIVLATAIFAIFASDWRIYQLFHQHYFQVGWELIKTGNLLEVVPPSHGEAVEIAIIILGLVVLECLVAMAVWYGLTAKRVRYLVSGFTVIFVVSLTLSYSLMTMATNDDSRYLSQQHRQIILKAARLAPYFTEVYALFSPDRFQHRRLEVDGEAVTILPKSVVKPLHYPRQSMRCMQGKKRPNVVMIMIDTWRFDAMNAEVTPHIHQFAQQAQQFTNHWSGGNNTKFGVFSLFYSLPTTYWNAFEDAKQGPVLLKQLQQADYDLGIFQSAPLTFPAFDKTVFADIIDTIAPTEGKNTIVRDKQITKNFLQFLKRRDADKPFFSFLFYDAVHNYCETPSADQSRFQPAIANCDRLSLTKNSDRAPYVNRYRNAAYFVDQQVQQVLAALKKQGLEEDTIIMITADHGEQLNDEKMGYWVHASNYTRHQLHIPLIIKWPGKRAGKMPHFTSHYDIAPTLLTSVLGCVNELEDYSVGMSLWDNQRPDYVLTGSYGDYALVAPDQVIRLYQTGDYEINNLIGHSIQQAPLNIGLLKRANSDMRRFFKDESTS